MRHMFTLFSIILMTAVGFWQPANAQYNSYGDWRSEFQMGVISYRVENGTSNSLSINCNESSDSYATDISVRIQNIFPSSNSQVKFSFGEDIVQMVTSVNGFIETDNRVNAENFAYLWDKLRQNRFLTVTFANGLSQIFSLDGAARLLPTKTCTTEYFRGSSSNSRASQPSVSATQPEANSRANLSYQSIASVFEKYQYETIFLVLFLVILIFVLLNYYGRKRISYKVFSTIEIVKNTAQTPIIPVQPNREALNLDAIFESIEMLEKLFEFKSRQILSDEEYHIKKREALKGLMNG